MISYVGKALGVHGMLGMVCGGRVCLYLLYLFFFFLFYYFFSLHTLRSGEMKDPPSLSLFLSLGTRNRLPSRSPPPPPAAYVVTMVIAGYR